MIRAELEPVFEEVRHVSGVVFRYEREDRQSHANSHTFYLAAVEKIVALGDRARNEPRDLYDAWYLTSEGPVNVGGLTAEVEGKLEFRGRTLATLGEEFRKKEARLKKLWSARLAAQMVRLPEFDGVFRALQRSLRQAGLMG